MIAAPVPASPPQLLGARRLGSAPGRRRALGLCLTLGAIAFPATASAYCRQKTCEDIDCSVPDAPSDCVDVQCQRDSRDCITEGDDLFYASACLQFAVEAGAAASVGLTDVEFEDVVLEAFQRWADVDCGGGEGPGFMASSAGVVEAHGRFFCEQLPELNLSVWRFTDPCVTAQEDELCWRHSDLALGYTTSTFGVESGRIFDADVELNQFRIVASYPADVLRRVVLSIVTHEAGHFLGLAHSDNDRAIMATSYSGLDLLGRDFDQDDVDGVCSIFPPAGLPDECSEPGVSDAALSQAACHAAATGTGNADCSVGTVAGSRESGGSSVPIGFGLGVVGCLALGARRRARGLAS